MVGQIEPMRAPSGGGKQAEESEGSKIQTFVNRINNPQEKNRAQAVQGLEDCIKGLRPFSEDDKATFMIRLERIERRINLIKDENIKTRMFKVLEEKVNGGK